MTTPIVTSSSITVQWGPVNCREQNGDITGYSVRYGVQGSGEGDKTVVMVTGDSSGGMYEITELTSSTTYSIEVAAVNRNGTGPYSAPVVVGTHQSCTCTDNTAAITGLTTVVVVLLVTMAVLIFVLALVWGSRHGNLCIHKFEE